MLKMDHFFYFLLQVNHCIVLVNCSCHKWKQTSPKMDSARSLEARLIWANIWPTSANRLITLNSTQPRRTSKVATVAMSMYLSLRMTTCSIWAWGSLINLKIIIKKFVKSKFKKKIKTFFDYFSSVKSKLAKKRITNNNVGIKKVPSIQCHKKSMYSYLRFRSYFRPRNLERLLNQDKPRPLIRWDNSLHFAVSWLSVWTKAISSENLWRSQSPSCRCFHNWSLRQCTAAAMVQTLNFD